MRKKQQNQQPRAPRTALDIINEHYSDMLALLRCGVSMEDLQYVDAIAEINRLKDAPEYINEYGMTDWPKLNGYICRKYYITEASLWRAKKRLEREIE